MDISLAIALLEKSTEKCYEITDNNSSNNYETVKFEPTIECRIKPDILGFDSQNNTAFSSGMEETSALKTFSTFTLRSNTSQPLEQSSDSSSVTPLVQGSKYVFYDDNGRKFIIDNADFEEEEQELIDIFNSNPIFSYNNPNFELFENLSYSKEYHFYPISTNSSSEEDEEMKENIDCHTNEGVDNYELSNLKRPQKVELSQIFRLLIIKITQMHFRVKWKKQALQNIPPSLTRNIFHTIGAKF
ncbi:hypothetical protein TNCT_169311 [Trichonephila clavata]|uniref:Uncharacterized protein n=1 Tax=Trichonephila clavata TaxID=2740835 RepID=A0A8X6GDY1_TRICU|nr:hypothetical protein TNCT_169311 [Trichonephila clavata]